MAYSIQDREAGNVIATLPTLAEAEATLAGYETSDRAEGVFESNFYEIVEVEA